MPIIQTTKFKSSLPEEEVARLLKERAQRFLEVPGLIQKYYLRDPQTSEIGAVYVWESAEALNAFRQSELAQSMGDAYQIVGDKRVEIYEVTNILRK